MTSNTDSSHLFSALCGEYDSTEPNGGHWAQGFVGANIVRLCEIIIPGDQSQCLMHDTLHVNESRNYSRPVDYVPVKNGVAIFDPEFFGTVDCHYFITRLGDMRDRSTRSTIDLDQCSIGSMFNVWSHIAHAMRHMLQVKYGARMSSLPFVVLPDLRVDRSMVSEAREACMANCQKCGIDGKKERLDYMDRCSVAVLVAHVVKEEARKAASASIKMNLQPIAEAIMRNAPRQ